MFFPSHKYVFFDHVFPTESKIPGKNLGEKHVQDERFPVSKGGPSKDRAPLRHRKKYREKEEKSIGKKRKKVSGKRGKKYRHRKKYRNRRRRVSSYLFEMGGDPSPPIPILFPIPGPLRFLWNLRGPLFFRFLWNRKERQHVFREPFMTGRKTHGGPIGISPRGLVIEPPKDDPDRTLRRIFFPFDCFFLNMASLVIKKKTIRDLSNSPKAEHPNSYIQIDIWTFATSLLYM